MSDFQFKATTLADSERSRRNSRLRLVHHQRSSSHQNSLKEGGLAPRIRMSMVNQPITDFSSPSATHISLGPQVEIGDIDFEIQPSLICLVQASTFSGKPHEDANTHLQNFLEVCSTIAIKGVIAGAIHRRLFPFTMLGKA